jgi:hypothetical protein
MPETPVDRTLIGEPLILVNNEINDSPQEEDAAVSKFDSWKYFIIHELQFCAMFTLEQGWIRSDNIFGPFTMDKANVAALGQLYTVISMVDCFCFGYGFATTSMMTDFLSKGKIKKTKTVGKPNSNSSINLNSMDVLGQLCPDLNSFHGHLNISSGGHS